MLRPATRKELSARPPKYLLDEIDRLMKLEIQSHKDLCDRIAALPMELPVHIRDILDPDAPSRESAAVQKHRNGESAPSAAASGNKLQQLKRLAPDGSDTTNCNANVAVPRKRLRQKTSLLGSQSIMSTSTAHPSSQFPVKPATLSSEPSSLTSNPSERVVSTALNVSFKQSPTVPPTAGENHSNSQSREEDELPSLGATMTAAGLGVIGLGVHLSAMHNKYTQCSPEEHAAKF